MGDPSDMFRCSIVDEHSSPDTVMVRDLRRDELIGLFEGLTEFPIEWLTSLTIERITMDLTNEEMDTMTEDEIVKRSAEADLIADMMSEADPGA